MPNDIVCPETGVRGTVSLWRVADRVALLGDARLLATGAMTELARSTDPAVLGFFQGPRGRAAQASA